MTRDQERIVHRIAHLTSTREFWNSRMVSGRDIDYALERAIEAQQFVRGLAGLNKEDLYT